MSLSWTKKMAHYILFLIAVGLSAPAMADYTLNMRQGVSPISENVFSLHMTIFWICTVIAVLVYSIMVYALIKHRKSKAHKAATFHESTTIEIIWTVIPFFILVAMAIPASITLFDMEDTTKSEMTIKVTGYRWYWHYDYLDEDINFFSYLSTPDQQVNNFQPKSKDYLLEVDNEVVVPTGTKIRFLITAKDVIHSWWVPDFGMKKDAIPGFIREMWTYIDPDKPGKYRGQCAELCGAKHGYMPIVVHAVKPAEYEKWLGEQRKAKASAQADEGKEWTFDELMVKGEKEYNTVCAMCHQANGKGLPPTFPSLVDSPMVKGADRIEDHIKNVIYGKGAMPAWGEQKSDLEIAAVVTYERNAWGLESGDVVQPKDVKALRGQQ